MMWRCERNRDAETRRHGDAGTKALPSFHRVPVSVRLRVFCLLLSAFCLLTGPACRRDMQDQPKMKPFRSSSFYGDGLSTRPPIEGTVARGFLKTDTEFFTGKKAGRTAVAQPLVPEPAGTTGSGTALTGAAAYPDDVEVFPIAVTKEMVTRGKERYEIFCSACHE